MSEPREEVEGMSKLRKDDEQVVFFWYFCVECIIVHGVEVEISWCAVFVWFLFFLLFLHINIFCIFL